ncbi:MAG: Ig-like domain-containing protein [Acidobacteriia bacterium]|nr:Ig-like domain-containing protein [Terriglobia bacterium]
MINGNGRSLKLAALLTTTLATCALVYYQPDQSKLNDIPNRLPEAAPYVVAEAQAFPPPYHDHWEQEDSPGQCQTCHQKIFDEWNGSMMSNSWRDPAWRAAFLALARATSANGECDTPEPPDGTAKAAHNPFANKGECSSTFDIGTDKYTVSRPGSLLDFFCSRCHMPTDYVDNIPLRNVKLDPNTNLESAPGDPNFNPTSDNGTGIAFAAALAQYRNTDSGKSGIICAVCHTNAETRDTPFHNYSHSASAYVPAQGTKPRNELLAAAQQDIFNVPDSSKQNLGYSIGAGSYRLSPHAIGSPERFGPLAANPTGTDTYTSQIFGQEIPYQKIDPAKHKGYHQAMFLRAEMCAACHDVTNALPIKNPIGKWVGGFPIERTYTEWANSVYADRPGNKNFDSHFKRDCQSCHMQQDYGQPGTAQTLYKDGKPLPPQVDRVANEGGSPHPFFTHHFVGGNAYVTGLIGKDVDQSGNVAPYPELSAFSFSSADEKSPYSRGFWTHTERKGAYSQQARLAWDRLRHVLSMDVHGPATAPANTSVPLSITIANTGSGHDFPTGFPEGRTAWLSLHAYDLATGKELQIQDNVWKRSSVGVGNLTTEEMVDPNFPGCNWKIPAGSADPYSVQFKAVASLGDGCPTLDLPYATPLNLVTNKAGLPIDKDGRVIDRNNSTALPQFKDNDGNGDLFDDSFLRDTRFKPRGRPEYEKKIDRYSVVIPQGTQGPVAVTAAVYYQSIEAVVALHFLGNMADTNNNFVLEPCVLGGLCDGRKPTTEPAVVEGAPPVPMVVRNWVISVDGGPADKTVPRVAVYPASGTQKAYQDTVVKVFFSKPVRGVDSRSFTLTDSTGKPVPAWVDQVGDATWGLFPDPVLLKPGESYSARLKAGVCDLSGQCTKQDTTWRFTVCKESSQGTGDTSIPIGFTVPELGSASAAPRATAVHEKSHTKVRLASK